MCGQERKRKKATPRNTKAPALRTIESAAAGLASLKHPRRNPAPLVPRSGVFQGDFEALCEERGSYVFSLFANDKQFGQCVWDETRRFRYLGIKVGGQVPKLLNLPYFSLFHKAMASFLVVPCWEMALQLPFLPNLEHCTQQRFDPALVTSGLEPHFGQA